MCLLQEELSIEVGFKEYVFKKNSQSQTEDLPVRSFRAVYQDVAWGTQVAAGLTMCEQIFDGG